MGSGVGCAAFGVGIAFMLQWAAVIAKYGSSSTYAFLHVQSRHTPSEGQRFCPPLHLAWLGDRYGELDVCEIGERRYSRHELVPALYRTIIGANETECHRSIDAKHVMASQAHVLAKHNVTLALWLMRRGRPNHYHFHDYLFSNFFDPEISFEPPYSFFMYDHVFFKEVLPAIYSASGPSQSEAGNETVILRFYRPLSTMPVDAGVFIIAALAIGCVLFGSLWAAYDTWTELNVLDSATRLRDELDAAGGTTETPRNQPADASVTDSVVVIEEGNINLPPQADQPRSVDPAKQKWKRRREEKRSEQRKTAVAVHLSKMHWASHCCSALFFAGFLTTILMIAYFFRDYAINAFNIFSFIIGTFCIHKVVYALLQIVFSKNRRRGVHDFDVELFRLGQLFCCGAASSTTQTMTTTTAMDVEASMDGDESALPSPSIGRRSSASKSSYNLRTRWSKFSRRPVKLLSLLIFCGSAAFCSTWLYMWLTNNMYAFLLLDIMNVNICLVGIRDSACRSMRLITFIMLTLFIYDLFMVFGSTLVTANGCSIMLQVATGMNCNKPSNTSEVHPVPPIDADIPKKIPILFYVPYISDPMRECYDLEVEDGFDFMLLGLGDVILPGFLVSYAFYIDIAKRHRFYSFGIITWLGYVAGLVITFLALYVMRVGQPALIYLVPSTMLPLTLWAWYNGMLAEIWRGGDLTCPHRPRNRPSTARFSEPQP